MLGGGHRYEWSCCDEPNSAERTLGCVAPEGQCRSLCRGTNALMYPPKCRPREARTAPKSFDYSASQQVRPHQRTGAKFGGRLHHVPWRRDQFEMFESLLGSAQKSRSSQEHRGLVQGTLLEEHGGSNLIVGGGKAGKAGLLASPRTPKTVRHLGIIAHHLVFQRGPVHVGGRIASERASSPYFRTQEHRWEAPHRGCPMAREPTEKAAVRSVLQRVASDCSNSSRHLLRRIFVRPPKKDSPRNRETDSRSD